MRTSRTKRLGVSSVVLAGLWLILALASMVITPRLVHAQQAGDGSAAAQPPPPVSFGPVVIGRVDHLPRDDNPLDPAWETVGDVLVPMLPQTLAMPTLDVPSVTEARVRALTDGQRISWRITWADAAPDQSVDAGRFCDAAAIQFPLTPNAPFTMGITGMQVQIIHWKAVWQKDIDDHFQDVQDLHPNYWSDLYWFATAVPSDPGQPPSYRVPESFRDPVSIQWFTGRAAGNPVSEPERSQPVEELVAQGFGTLTHQEDSESTGRGVWRDGRWSVVFTRPLKNDDPSDYQFAAGSQAAFSIAIWEGGAGNVGGRKQWSNWTQYEALE